MIGLVPGTKVFLPVGRSISATGLMAWLRRHSR